MSANDEITLPVEPRPQKIDAPVAAHFNESEDERSGAAHSRRVGPVCFEDRIPSFVERAIKPLQGVKPMNTARTQASHKAAKTHSYVHLQEGDADVTLLYKIEGRSLLVLNQGVKLSAHAIAVFAEHVLARYPKVGCVRMYGTDTELALLRMPLLKVPSKRESVDHNSGLPRGERKLFDLTIYRSRSDMALQPGPALSAWSHRLRSRARKWMGGRP